MILPLATFAQTDMAAVVYKTDDKTIAYHVSEIDSISFRPSDEISQWAAADTVVAYKQEDYQPRELTDIEWVDGAFSSTTLTYQGSATFKKNYETSKPFEITQLLNVHQEGLANHSSSGGTKYYSAYTYTVLDENDNVLEVGNIGSGSYKDIFPREYGDKRVFLVVSRKKGSEASTSILANKYKTGKRRRIVLVGDSLTGCGNYIGFMTSIAGHYGYEVTSCYMGGENMTSNMVRCGAVSLRLTEGMSIPAEPQTLPIRFQSSRRGATGDFETVNFGNAVNVTLVVGGIEGTLSRTMGYVAFYQEDGAFISAKNIAVGNLTAPSGSAFLRFSVNKDNEGGTHVTIAGEPVEIETAIDCAGSIVNSKGDVVANSLYDTGKAACHGGDAIYVDGLAAARDFFWKRSAAGEAVELSVGTTCWAKPHFANKDNIHIVNTGQNGGYTDAQDWCDRMQTVYDVMSEHTLAVSSPFKDYGDAPRLMFGDKYVSLKDYMENEITDDALRIGLIETVGEGQTWRDIFYGSDKVHQGRMASYLWAVLYWNRLVDLGWVDGEKVDGGKYYE